MSDFDVTDGDLQQLEREAAAEQAEQIDPAADPQAAPEAGPPAVPTDQLLRPVVDLLCAGLAPAWGIQEAERQAVAEAYAALLDKYFPEGPGAWGVELNAALITAAILTPRIGRPRFPEPAQEEPEQQEGGDDGT